MSDNISKWYERQRKQAHRSRAMRFIIFSLTICGILAGIIWIAFWDFRVIVYPLAIILGVFLIVCLLVLLYGSLKRRIYLILEKIGKWISDVLGLDE
ncbi:hypothetical protein HYV89_02335 [Candidatus Woesearchaeota archaeon]|nr:hypothetical protein [Candidatus Woesearchaeota archaeon]